MTAQEKQDRQKFHRLYNQKDEQTKDYIMAMISMAAMVWNQARTPEREGRYYKEG